MKFSSSLALALAGLLALSAGCMDAVQPEPLPYDPSAFWVKVSSRTVPWVREGFTVQLSASAIDAYGTIAPQHIFTWRSSNEAIATVSEGLVTGKARGEVLIYATTAGKQGEMSLTILGPNDSPWDF
jgi:hypothetical protein